MARTLHAEHLSTQPTPLATALYLGLCLLALALAAAATDLLLAPYHPPTILRSPALPRSALPRPPTSAREAVQARPAAPSPVVQRAAGRPQALAPSDPGGLLSALRELAAEGRLPEPSTIDPALRDGGGPRTALTGSGRLALSTEPERLNVRRGGALAGEQRLDDLFTSGTQEVSYGPKPVPDVRLDEAVDGAGAQVAEGDLPAVAPGASAT